MNTIVSASILSADLCRLGEELDRAEKCGCDHIHFDVMDGVFVNNISYGIPVLASVRKHTKMFIDVHLMITDPIRYIDAFADNGADMISFHLEAAPDPAAVISAIKAKGKKAGIAIKPATPVSDVLPYAESADMILIMTVDPGFGGQGFIYESLDKIRELKAYPGLLLFGFGMFLYLFRYLQIRYRNNTDFNFRGTILVSAVFVCAIIAADSVFFSSNALYLYPKSADNEAAVEKYAGSTGLFVSYDYYQLTAKLLEVAKLSRIHALIPDQKAISSFCDRNYIDSDDLVVYMNNHDCEEEVLSQLKDELGYSGFKKLPGYTQIDDGTSCFVYVFYR